MDLNFRIVLNYMKEDMEILWYAIWKKKLFHKNSPQQLKLHKVYHQRSSTHRGPLHAAASNQREFISIAESRIIVFN